MCAFFHIVIETLDSSKYADGTSLMIGVVVPSTASRIEALAQLIRAALKVAENLTVTDEEARLELLDSLAVAHLNALRLTEDNSVELRLGLQTQ